MTIPLWLLIPLGILACIGAFIVLAVAAWVVIWEGGRYWDRHLEAVNEIPMRRQRRQWS